MLPELIRVRIGPRSENQLKVVWMRGERDYPPYHIDVHQLQRSADAARTALEELVKARLANTADLAPALRKLATAGVTLRKNLFDALEENDTTTAQIEEWLARNTADIRFHFTVADRVHIPWGLVFDPPVPAEAVKGHDIAVFGGFWSIKYHASATRSRLQPQLGSDCIRRADYTLLPVLNQNIWDQLKSHAALSAHEKKLLDEFFDRAPPAYSKNDLFQRWNKVADKNGMLFFLCHADGTSLALGQNDLLTMDELKQELKRAKSAQDETGCLVFLNGCTTAVGDPEGGFMEATGRRGFLGFIGTETQVPALFALRFSLEFMQRFFGSGTPLLLVMRDIRRQHWPLSLLYSVYCYPLVSISDQQPPVAPPPQGNLSDAPVLSSML